MLNFHIFNKKRVHVMNNILKGSSIALIFIALSGCGSDDND
jgi:hypothetical protein